MKSAVAAVAVLVVASQGLAHPSAAGPSDPVRVTGDYVEARTAEVFAGGCIMNSEAETAGRQALLAWRVASGTVQGVRLDGLAVVAAVVGERNLGMREMGGEDPGAVRAIITVDSRAGEAQKRALVDLARELTGTLVTEVVRVDTAAITFNTTADRIDVSTADAVKLHVSKSMVHDPSCGAMQWFKPFSARLTSSAMGTADAHAFSGSGLGSKWSAPNKKSAFWGTFSY